MKLNTLRRPISVALTSILQLGLFACAFATTAVCADAYTFTRINIPGAVDVYGQGLNNQGDIAGNFVNASGVTGWVRTKSGVTTYYNFGVPGTTEINSLNDAGLAWGTYLGNDDIGHGFTLAHGIKTDLDFPGAFATVPIGFNNRGLVSGVVVDATGVHGFIRNRGIYALFDYPGAEVTLLFSNNEHGQILGVYFDAQGGHGFLMNGTTIIPVNFPGAAYTQPSSINNRGDIVGHYQSTPNLPAHIPEHGLLVRHGVYGTLNYPGAVATRLFQINDAGDIIGSALDAQGRSFGFLATLGKNGGKK